MRLVENGGARLALHGRPPNSALDSIDPQAVPQRYRSQPAHCQPTQPQDSIGSAELPSSPHRHLRPGPAPCRRSPPCQEAARSGAAASIEGARAAKGLRELGRPLRSPRPPPGLWQWQAHAQARCSSSCASQRGGGRAAAAAAVTLPRRPPPLSSAGPSLEQQRRAARRSRRQQQRQRRHHGGRRGLPVCRDGAEGAHRRGQPRLCVRAAPG